MIDKKTVFVLGAGASCPYGYPSGVQLRKQICLDKNRYLTYLSSAYHDQSERSYRWECIRHFSETFFKSSTPSIDLFLSRNPHLAPTGKYIIAFEMFDSELRSHFHEQAIEGQDWYSYLFQRFTEEFTGANRLPDFSKGKLGFITFNYDRSLEHFLYESFRNSFTNIPEHEIFRSLKGLMITHVYGQTVLMKWQDPNDHVDYAPQIYEALLAKAASNIKTIYEEKESQQIAQARDMLGTAERIFFLGFGYAQENMEVLSLPGLISESCWIYGTAYGLETKEISDIRERIVKGLKPGGYTERNIGRVKIDNVDCLKLLRNYL